MPRRLRKVLKPTNNTTHTTKPTRSSLHGRPSGPMASALELLRTLDAVSDGDHEVVEQHAPASDEAAIRMQSAPNIRVSGPGGWIEPGHASIAPRCQHHRRQRNKDRQRHVAKGLLVGEPKYPHRPDWLNQNESVENEVTQAKDTTQARRRLAFGAVRRSRDRRLRAIVRYHGLLVRIKPGVDRVNL